MEIVYIYKFVYKLQITNYLDSIYLELLIFAGTGNHYEMGRTTCIDAPVLIFFIVAHNSADRVG